MLHLPKTFEDSEEVNIIADSKMEDEVALWHKRLGHTHEDNIINADRAKLLEGVNLNNQYFRKKYKKLKK